jgi:sporulation protein YlmC with PRC-barrel domain
MRPERLNGKAVIDSAAQILGEVAGVEIDLSTWKLTHLCINLSDTSIETLGYKKPFIGKIQVDLPVEIVKAVKDVVAIDKSTAEIRSLIEPHHR